MLSDDTVFKLDKMANQSYEKDDIVIMDVTIEMNLNLGFIQRTSYNVLDVLSDIGGIQSIILTTFSVLMSILNYKHFDSYMASKLYKLKAPSESNNGSSSHSSQPSYIIPTRFCNVGHYLINLIPKKCHCLSRKQRK